MWRCYDVAGYANRGRALPARGGGEVFSSQFASSRSLRSLRPSHAVNGVVAEMARQLGRKLQFERHPLRPGDVPHSQNGRSWIVALLPEDGPVLFDEGLIRKVASVTSR